MRRANTFRLDEHHVVLTLNGPGQVLSAELPGTARRAGDLVRWDPQVDGLLAKAGTQFESSDHSGERHLDGDELLFVVEGAMRVVLEPEDGEDAAAELAAGDAMFVPRGVWHHIEVYDRVNYLFVGGGRTDIRVTTGAS